MGRCDMLLRRSGHRLDGVRRKMTYMSEWGMCSGRVEGKLWGRYRLLTRKRRVASHRDNVLFSRESVDNVQVGGKADGRVVGIYESRSRIT